MGSNTVVINEKIKFTIDDTGMNRLFSLLNSAGMLVMDCPWCGLTILPQVRSHYHSTREKEFKVTCVGCDKIIGIRYYGDYGFLLEK